jgi:MFS transporter, AAHS family, 4-hydroxybenzoate transporter
MNRHKEIIEVAQFVDNCRLGKFHYQVLLFSFLILFVEGIDYTAMNAAAPEILRAFHAQKSAMGIVFGWGFFGILLGSLLFGYMGDRWGRRFGAISGVLTYTIPALLSPLATSLDQLMCLRFLAGLGIGGVVPNTIALLTETTPKQFRARFVVFAFVGYSLGNTAIARAAAWLIPQFGWPAAFLVAGTTGTLLSIWLAFVLPESIRFLALRHPNSEKLHQLAHKLAPGRFDGRDTQFLVRRESSVFSLRLLFDGYRRIATPFLWVCYFAESLTFMTLQSWLPVLLEALSLPPARATVVFSYATFAGIPALLLVAKPLDKMGPQLASLLGLLAMAAIVLMGMPELPVVWIAPLAIVAGATCAATHNSLNGIVGSFYPTSIRSNGIGVASGMGRIAGIVGPVVTGYLLSSKLALWQVLSVIAGPYVLVVVICFFLARIYRRNLTAESQQPAETVSAGTEVPQAGLAPSNCPERLIPDTIAPSE